MKKLIMLACSLIVVGLVGLGLTYFVVGKITKGEDQLTKTFNQSNINGINIQTKDIDTQVKRSDNNKVKVILQAKNRKIPTDQLKVFKNGNLLNISLKSYPHIGFVWEYTHLTVYLPAKMYDTLQIKSTSGDIIVADLAVKQAIIDTSSGDVQVNTLQSEQTKINTLSGDVVLTKTKAGQFNVATISGDIALRESEGAVQSKTQSGDLLLQSFKQSGDLYVQSSSGDAAIGILNPESFHLHYKGSSGDVITRVSGLKFTEKGGNTTDATLGSGKYQIDVKTHSGDLLLEEKK